MRYRDERRPIAADPAGAEAAGAARAAVGERSEVEPEVERSGQERPVDERPVDEPTGDFTLLEADEEVRFQERWRELQTEFVDDPRAAVRRAHGLVSELTDRLTDRFTRERDELERQWEDSGEASTETLRLAVRRYRAFFERLLAI